MTADQRRDKFEGALLGTMVGDALGAPVEGVDGDRIRTLLDRLPLMPAPERELNVSLFGLITGRDVAAGMARYTDDTQTSLTVNAEGALRIDIRLKRQAEDAVGERR